MITRTLRGSADVKLEDGRFAGGRVFGARSRLERGSDEPAIERFKIPDGKRMVQLRYVPKKAHTLVGDVLNFAGQLKQYTAQDKNGNPYTLAGYCAIVKRSRGDYVEMFYNGDPEGDPYDAGYKAMLDFKEVDRDEINEKDDTVVTLFFIVPPRTEIAKVVDQNGKGVEVRLKAGRG